MSKLVKQLTANHFCISQLIALPPLLLCLLACLSGRSLGQTGSSISLSQTDITSILDRLNEIRSNVNPSASNMNVLQWNAGLAAAADTYAQNCRLELNPDLPSQDFSSVGQIWSAAGSSTLNFITIIDGSWLRPRSFYNYTANTCLSPGACTNYTQVIRAVSTDVGCGAALCPQITTFPVPNSIIYFCYFSPEGDRDQQPYIQGLPCSTCTSDQICVNNLCATVPPTTVPPTIATTMGPTTAMPTTAASTTVQTTTPTTVPTTSATTATPTTPTTPTTVISTAPPTTEKPISTTVLPTTIMPTTSRPTTAKPTTLMPTKPKPPCPMPKPHHPHHPHPHPHRHRKRLCPPAPPPRPMLPPLRPPPKPRPPPPPTPTKCPNSLEILLKALRLKQYKMKTDLSNLSENPTVSPSQLLSWWNEKAKKSWLT